MISPWPRGCAKTKQRDSVSHKRKRCGPNSLVCWKARTFRNSKRCKEFLDYVVEHTIHGPSGTLKERSIGVELFALPQDFDTGQHTIVRVTANEVRKKLAQHYLAENGSFHPVKISLPPGSYSAEFKWESSPPAPVEAPRSRAGGGARSFASGSARSCANQLVQRPRDRLRRIRCAAHRRISFVADPNGEADHR